MISRTAKDDYHQKRSKSTMMKQRKIGEKTAKEAVHGKRRSKTGTVTKRGNEP